MGKKSSEKSLIQLKWEYIVSWPGNKKDNEYRANTKDSLQ